MQTYVCPLLIAKETQWEYCICLLCKHAVKMHSISCILKIELLICREIWLDKCVTISINLSCTVSSTFYTLNIKEVVTISINLSCTVSSTFYTLNIKEVWRSENAPRSPIKFSDILSPNCAKDIYFLREPLIQCQGVSLFLIFNK
jgi:hypothetical protein